MNQFIATHLFSGALFGIAIAKFAFPSAYAASRDAPHARIFAKQTPAQAEFQCVANRRAGTYTCRPSMACDIRISDRRVAT
jgi:hypothetical protein